MCCARSSGCITLRGSGLGVGQPGSEEAATRPPGESSRSLTFERIADSYDATRGGEGRGRRFAAELHPFLDLAEPALEIGVGTGVVALGLKEFGHRIIGVDLSEAMLGYARRRIGPRVAAADAMRLPVADSSVAQVLIVWVLHVVGDVAAALGEVGRVLRPGGRFLVVPAMHDEPADPIGRIIRDMQTRLDSRGRRSDEEQRVRSLAAAAGLRLAEARDLRAADYEESPAQAIRKVEARS
jgi:ubiquinone/menaquinone biosynthesis C-methylase UbiE